MTGSDWLAGLAGVALLAFVFFAFVKGDKAKPTRSNNHQSTDEAERYKSGQLGSGDA